MRREGNERDVALVFLPLLERGLGLGLWGDFTREGVGVGVVG